MIRVSKIPGLAMLVLAVGVLSPDLSAQQRQAPAPPAFEEAVDVVAATPLPGVEMPADQIAAPVQSATSKAASESRRISVSASPTRPGHRYCVSSATYLAW